MADETGHEVTRLLRAWKAGDEDALNRLFPILYDELRSVAASHLRRERPDHTLQPTALVNEAYLRILPRQGVAAEDRVQFIGIAVQAIRRILVDHAREKLRMKRGGNRHRVTLTARLAREDPVDVEILDMDRALTRLGEDDPLNQQVVELRYFGGLSETEVGRFLGISERTVRRRWVYSRAWLFRELASEGRDAG